MIEKANRSDVADGIGGGPPAGPGDTGVTRIDSLANRDLLAGVAKSAGAISSPYSSAAIEDLRRDVIAFCDEVVRPRADALDKSGEYPNDIHRAMNDRRLLRLIVPTDVGGAGYGHMGRAVLIEEIARVSAAVSMIPMVNELGCTPIIIAGTSEQRRLWLTPVAAGKMFASYGLTERDAGSDGAAIATTARRDGDHWVINGEKAWICNVQQPGFCILFARTDAERKHAGLSAFIVPTDAPGFKVLGAEPTLGLRGSPTYNLALEDVRVPSSHLLGREGDGFLIAMKTLDRTRAAVGAQALGIARASFEAAMDHATRRRTFGNLLIDHQSIGFQIADVDMRIRAARHVVYEANALLDQSDGGDSHASSVAKCFASDVAMHAAMVAVDVFGGNGYSTNYIPERLMRDAKVTQIFEGANSIQRMVIARNLKKKWVPPAV